MTWQAGVCRQRLTDPRQGLPGGWRRLVTTRLVMAGGGRVAFLIYLLTIQSPLRPPLESSFRHFTPQVLMLNSAVLQAVLGVSTFCSLDRPLLEEAGRTLAGRRRRTR